MILLKKALGVELERKLGVAGQFKLVKRSAGGIILQETPWFDNLVLDAGLNRWFTNNIIAGVSIGTGTSAPVASQTALDSFSAYTSTAQVTNSATAQGSAPYYITHQYAYRFAIGALNGNFTEVGIGWASNTLFSRALIVDNVGVPTSISITPAEQLDVYYSLRLYVPAADISVGKTIGGVATTVTGRAANCTQVNTAIGTWNNGFNGVIASANLTGAFTSATDGAIGAITASPSGANYSGTITVAPVGAYSNNSLTRTYRTTFDLNAANFGAGIGAVVAQWQGISALFQYGFSPKVAKTAAFTFYFDHSISVARH